MASLPPLRQDLSLHPGPSNDDGSPSWTLHDPAANRFYQLGWPAFEILSRWSLADGEAVIQAVNNETTLTIGPDEIAAITDFVGRHNLIVAASPEQTERLTRIARASKQGLGKWLLSHYLFFRIPLFQPMPLLNRLAPLFALCFDRRFWWLIAAIAVVGLGLVSQRWDAFTHTFAAYGGINGLIGIGIALGVGKVLHELGHALTAHRFGCRVPAMGVAFLVMLPVLYTDTNEAWKLSSRRQRLLIGGAGMLAELVLAAVATLVWSFLDDGPLRAGVFMLATTTWVATLAINASPFMRFDGYFLLADYLNLPNLHSRAFAFGRIWLRRHLLGLNLAWPEPLPPQRQRFMVLFAMATWLYRLVLFLGIALLVYQMFFKALGLLLLVVELLWFIALPVWSELKNWWQLRDQLRWNWPLLRSLSLLTALLVMVLVPWQSAVTAPAIISASQISQWYAPVTADVAQVWVANGAEVEAGTPLVQLAAPEVDDQLALARVKLDELRWQQRQQPFDAELRALGHALDRQVEAAEAQLASLEQQRQRLTFVAPFSGRVLFASDALVAGTVVAAGEKLLSLIAPQGVKVEAYVGEELLTRLQPGSSTHFVADNGNIKVDCTLAAVDRFKLSEFDHLNLASSHGGPVASEHLGQRLVPRDALFRVRLEPCSNLPALWYEQAGRARLSADQPSLLVQGWRWLAATLHQQSNF